MRTFRDIAIQEALKIVKKKGQEKEQRKIDISHFDECDIIRTKHTKEVRDGQDVPRDDGLRDAVILRVVKKAWKKGLQSDTKTMVTYKNKKKKYDMIVIEWKQKQKKIILVTSIQDGKESPKLYFTPKHKNDEKIMTERVMEIIDLDD